MLRKQNQRFVEEQAHTISGVSTQATGFDAALAARAARQATEAAQQTATPQESTPARPKPDGMPPDPHRPRPPDPVPIGEIRPGRDTLAFLVLAAAAWTAGAVFAAGIRGKLSAGRIGGTHGSPFAAPASSPVEKNHHVGRKIARGVVRTAMVGASGAYETRWRPSGTRCRAPWAPPPS
ncbi:hypothetical protein ACH4KT_33055 [Streptomyces anulatus]